MKENVKRTEKIEKYEKNNRKKELKWIEENKKGKAKEGKNKRK